MMLSGSFVRSCSLVFLLIHLTLTTTGSPVYSSYHDNSNNQILHQDSMPVDSRDGGGSSFIGVQREFTPIEEAEWMAAISQPGLGREMVSDGAPVSKRYGESAITNYSTRLNRYRLYQIQQNMFRNMLMNQRDDKDAIAKRSEGVFTNIWAQLRQRDLYRLQNKALNSMINHRMRRTNTDSPMWESYNVQPSNTE